MTQVLVVDASVAIKWFVPEKQHRAALSIFDQDVWLIAPEFILLEASSALQKKLARGEATPDLARQALIDLRSMFDEVYPAFRVFIRAHELSLTLGHPVYDCAYLALAELRGAVFLTADREFWELLQGTPYTSLIRLLGE